MHCAAAIGKTTLAGSAKNGPSINARYGGMACEAKPRYIAGLRKTTMTFAMAATKKIPATATRPSGGCRQQSSRTSAVTAFVRNHPKKIP